MKARIQSWTAETHAAGIEMLRHFLARFFDSELVTAPGQLRKAAIGALAGLIPAALLVYPTFVHRYTCVAIGQPSLNCPPITDYAAQYFLLVRTDVCWLISLSVCITALVTALRWQSLFPGKRDCLALASLPVSARDIFQAKLTSLLLTFAGFVLALNLLPSVLFAAVIASRWQINPSLLVNAVATLAATSGACVFVFFSLLALQGAMLILLPPRLFARASVHAQSILFTLSVAALPFLWREPGPSTWWPPNWFLDLWLAITGARGASARGALLAMAVPPLLAVLAYLAGYYRYNRLLLEGPGGFSHGRPATRIASRLLEAWVRDPREQAMLAFIWKTLARSRAHQLALQICAGLSLAWVIQGIGSLTGGPKAASAALHTAVLVVPPMVAAFLIAALRYLFSLPVELPANWLFQTTEHEGREAWLRATDRFVVCCGLVPIYLLTAPAAVAAFGWAEALRLSLLGFMMALVMFEFWFRNWRKAPFTCSHLPGERPLWLILVIGLAALSGLTTVFAVLYSFAASWVGSAAIFPLEMALFLRLHRQRRNAWEESSLVFEQQPEPAVTSLGIQAERGLEVELSAPELETVAHAASPFWNRFRESEDAAGAAAFPEGDRAAGPFFALAGLAEDVRFGLRLIRKNLLLSGTVLLTLALGIGMNVSVLTLINGFALRARVDHPETFARVAFPYPGQGSGVGRATPDEYRVYRDRSRSLSSLAAWTPTAVTLGNDRSSEAGALLVSCNFFEVYGLRHAMLGRLFLANECSTPGQAPVTVLSEETWRDRFGADPRVIGKSIPIDDQPFTVVGVAPARQPSRVNGAAAWIPYTAQPLLEPGADMFRNQAATLILDGRLAPGFSRAAAQAELLVIARQMDLLHPGRKTTLAVTDGSILSMFGSGPTFFVLVLLVMSAPWIVLLITCANVTMLLLSRAVSRRHEVAVRLSLGAPRMRLLRMLLVESCLLAAIAGLASLYLARHVPALLFRFLANDAAYFPLAPDWRILAFVLGVVMAVGSVAGLAPAGESLKVDLTASLKGYSSADAGSGGGLRVRSLLVSAQVALSLVLVVGAGLISRLDYRAFVTGRGLDTGHLLAIPLRFPARSSLNSSQALYHTIEARIRALPGIRSVAYADNIPFLGSPQRVGRTGVDDTERTVMVNAASPGYLPTLGIPILQGRDFRESDQPPPAGAVPAIVSQSFARALSPNQYAVGQRLQVGPYLELEIIGVAKDVDAGADDGLEIYQLSGWNSSRTNLLVRFSGDARAAAEAVRTAVREANPALLVTPITLRAVFDQRHLTEWRLVLLLLVLGAVALLLAIAGIYGVVAFSVTQKTRELGIRVALGASRVDIWREVLASGAKSVGYGLFIGLWLSLLAESALKSFFAESLELEAGNPAVYLGAAMVLALAAVLAMVAPAWRGARSDPMKALHYE